jgi:hypothetical protein
MTSLDNIEQMLGLKPQYKTLMQGTYLRVGGRHNGHQVRSFLGNFYCALQMESHSDLGAFSEYHYDEVEF